MAFCEKKLSAKKFKQCVIVSKKWMRGKVNDMVADW